MKTKRRWAKKPKRPKIVDQVAYACAGRGLFLLWHVGAWEFLSCRTGKQILLWMPHNQTWSTPDRHYGRAEGPFAAMNDADRIQRQRSA